MASSSVPGTRQETQDSEKVKKEDQGIETRMHGAQYGEKLAGEMRYLFGKQENPGNQDPQSEAIGNTNQRGEYWRVDLSQKKAISHGLFDAISFMNIFCTKQV